MRNIWLPKEFYYLWRHRPPALTQKEFDRLRTITIWKETKDAAVVCRTFAISRATLYRWLKQFDPRDLASLKEKSRRPRTLRKPTWSLQLIMAVKRLRQLYPRWAKDKIAVLLKLEAIEASASTVGRIIKHLKSRGQLIESGRKSISVKRRA